MEKLKQRRLPNQYGSIKRLSGNRRRPYMVCVNPHVNRVGSYSYDVLGYFAARADALLALAEYNRAPIDLRNHRLTFSEVYRLFYADKYARSKRSFSNAAKHATNAAYKNCAPLHTRSFAQLRHSDLQAVVDACPLRHASLELIVSLLHQMYAFAIREELIVRDASTYLKINVPDDDEHGIRWSRADIDTLWAHADSDSVRIILLYLYTGFRATELSELPKNQINLSEMTMTGGKKTAAGKGRIVPIHPRIQPIVAHFCARKGSYLFSKTNHPICYTTLNARLKDTLRCCGIQTRYTLHDLRHTFCSLLHDAGVQRVIIDRLMGHTGKSLSEKVYTHETLEQLRNAIHLLP